MIKKAGVPPFVWDLLSNLVNINENDKLGFFWQLDTENEEQLRVISSLSLFSNTITHHTQTEVYMFNVNSFPSCYKGRW